MFRAAGHVTTVETRGGYGLEPNRVANVDGSRSRPDVPIQSFPYGHHETAIDATFSSPLITCRLAASSKTAGKTAAQREADKRSSHPDLVHIHPQPGNTLVFRGICWESEGHPGPDAHLLVTEVARKYATNSAIKKPETRAEKIRYNRFVRTWRTRISVLIAEGTARAVWTLAAGRPAHLLGDPTPARGLVSREPAIAAR